jgi:RNA polymerase sigma-32 factor
VRKFDPDRDLRLATYAMWWVRAAIQDHVVRSWSLVRVGKTAAHRALFFACKRLAASAAPGGPAMARFTDDMLQRLADRFRLPAAEIGAFVDRIAGRDQSLDAPVDEEGDETGLDRLAVEDRPDPEQAAIDTGMTRRWSGLIDRALSHLPAREAAIIRRRHLGDAAQTFEAIGRELGLSKDRVRQLEKQAIAKLKNSLKPMASAFDLPGRP